MTTSHQPTGGRIGHAGRSTRRPRRKGSGLLLRHRRAGSGTGRSPCRRATTGASPQSSSSPAVGRLLVGVVTAASLVLGLWAEPASSFVPSGSSAQFPVEGRAVRSAATATATATATARWQQQVQPSPSLALLSTILRASASDGPGAPSEVSSSSPDDGSGTTILGGGDVQKLNRFQAMMVRLGLQLFIVGMCVALPATLLPQKLLRKLKLVSTKRSQIMALSTGQFCSRWLLRLIPFCNVHIYKLPRDTTKKPLEPSIWVCNHMSMLDVFVLLGVDRQLRGRRKRPIKIVYWKGLEANPVTRLLFRQAGFIPVQMADNGNGNDNEYDVTSFKKLLKDAKEAFADGFDIGVLPEGQLNPTPEKGLLPVFSGAYTLARLSKRPIRMMALYGTNHLWDALEGMCCTSRVVKVKAYPHGRKYESAHDFVEAFTNVVGTFGKTGHDLPEPELTRWLTGTPSVGTAAATSSPSTPESANAATNPPESSSKQSA